MALRKFPTFLLSVLLAQAVMCVIHPDGVSKVSRYQDDSGNYDFGYTVSNSEGEHYHKASKDLLGRVVGSYGLTQSDGRRRIVDYVADENGFRAEVRSNEPGIVAAKSTDLSIKPIIGGGLDFAASEGSFGDRLRDVSSSVSYVRPREDEEHSIVRRPLLASESDDTLKQNRRISIARPIVVNSRVEDEPQERSALRNIEVPVFNRYRPPIDPFTAIRQPIVPPPSFQSVNRYPLRTEVPQPSTPPYGGIETRNPLLDPSAIGRYPFATPYPRRDPITRVPPVSMSTIHGGVGGMPFLINPTAPGVIPTTYPRVTTDSQNGFQLPDYGVADREVFDARQRHNYLLRAVAIPNGIQAVRVDPETGEIYNAQDLLINDPDSYPFDDEIDEDDNDDPRRNIDNFRNSYGDLSDRRFGNRQPPPVNVGSPSHRNYSSLSFGYNSRNNNNNNNFLNRVVPDEHNLSKPSARDLYAIARAFDVVSQRHDPRHPSTPPSRRIIPGNFYETRSNIPGSTGINRNIPPDFGRDTSLDEFRSRFPLTFRRQSLIPRLDEPSYIAGRGYRSLPEGQSNEKVDETLNSRSDS